MRGRGRDVRRVKGGSGGVCREEGISLDGVCSLLFPRGDQGCFQAGTGRRVKRISSMGMSFYASFQKGVGGKDLTMRATLMLPLFFLKVIALVSFVSVCGLRARRLATLYAGTGRTKVCTCLPNKSDISSVALPSVCACGPFNKLVPLPSIMICGRMGIRT